MRHGFHYMRVVKLLFAHVVGCNAGGACQAEVTTAAWTVVAYSPGGVNSLLLEDRRP